jgi:hypothetical protein
MELIDNVKHGHERAEEARALAEQKTNPDAQRHNVLDCRKLPALGATFRGATLWLREWSENGGVNLSRLPGNCRDCRASAQKGRGSIWTKISLTGVNLPVSCTTKSGERLAARSPPKAVTAYAYTPRCNSQGVLAKRRGPSQRCRIAAASIMRPTYAGAPPEGILNP